MQMYKESKKRSWNNLFKDSDIKVTAIWTSTISIDALVPIACTNLHNAADFRQYKPITHTWMVFIACADPESKNPKQYKRNRFAHSLRRYYYIYLIGSSSARLDWIHVNHPSRYIIHILYAAFVSERLRPLFFYIRSVPPQQGCVWRRPLITRCFILIRPENETIHMQMHRRSTLSSLCICPLLAAQHFANVRARITRSFSINNITTA